MGAGSAEGTSPRRAPAFPRGWTVLFGVVFAVLLASTLRFLLSDHLPARHLDAARTELLPLDDATNLLRVVVLDVPAAGQLRHEVRVRDGVPEVVIDWSAAPETEGEAGVRGERVLEVPVPRAHRVVVIDARWARREGLDVALADRPADGP